jgi:hypothetical protein
MRKEWMMRHFSKTVGGTAVSLLLSSILAGPAMLEAQVVVPDASDGRWPMQPISPNNNTLAPFYEGWYANDDGTFSLSFGYVNTNLDTLYIPLGENNFLDNPEFDGVQPTVFFSGRRRGVWSVTVPAEMRDADVWWTLTTEFGHTTKVPGRIGAVAYQLGWYPRPHGSVTPSVSFDSQSDVGRGPPGIWAEPTETVSAGSPLTLSVNATDPSERDLNDARMVGIPLRVVWSQLQGPGPVRYTRHMSNPGPETGANSGAGAGGARRPPPGPEVIMLAEGHGAARVIASFSVPGEYLMLAQVDNFDADDSGTQDQCCWTNGYVRVNVTP